MSSIPLRLVAVSAALSLAGSAFAQSFNVDIGIDNPVPSNTYGAAAGQPGPWNMFDVDQVFNNLVDVAGNTTNVSCTESGAGSGNYYDDNPATTGDHEYLLDDIQDLGNIGSNKTTYTISGLNDGTYDVYFYCWTPYDETDTTKARIIGGTAGNQVCGNTWTGTHVYGVTYVVDSVTIVGGADLELRVVPDNGWGSFNGFQIVESGSCASAPTTYCTPGTSASGCQAVISAVGTSSATAPSGFIIQAGNAEGNKSGLIYFGSAAKFPATAVGNSSSFQCVNPPVKRSQLLNGGGTNGNCDGLFSVDMNARWTAQPAQNPGAGATVYAQLWYRDPTNTSNQTTSRSDAITWSVCP
jgi:hypothetical protein